MHSSRMRTARLRIVPGREREVLSPGPAGGGGGGFEVLSPGPAGGRGEDLRCCHLVRGGREVMSPGPGSRLNRMSDTRL